jgi:transportin-3
MKAAEYISRKAILLEQNSVRVLEILLSLLHSGENDRSFKVISCISSWVRSGAIASEVLEKSPLVFIAFEAIKQDETFDVGADMICDLIVKSAKSPRSDNLIQQIYPSLIGLISILKEKIDEPDVARGICRILAEAGEWYSFIKLAIPTF